MLNFPRMMLLSIYAYLLVVFLASGAADKWIGIGLCVLFGVLSYKITGSDCSPPCRARLPTS